MLIHMLDSEDQIADWVIRGKSKEYKRTKTREHTSIQKVKDHLGGGGRTEECLAGAGEDELRRRGTSLLSSDASFGLSVGEDCSGRSPSSFTT